MTIDPTTLLAELAAIQRDVKTLAWAASIAGYSQTMSDLGDRTLERIGLVMSSIAAQPAVPITSPGTYAAPDNGMLAPIKARLAEVEKQVAAHGLRLVKHDLRIATIAHGGNIDEP